MHHATTALLLTALAAPTAAAADPAAAGACAAGLPPNARMVYDAVAPGLKPGDALPDAIRSHTRALVMDGKLTRAMARPAAMAAAECLKMLK